MPQVHPSETDSPTLQLEGLDYAFENCSSWPDGIYTAQASIRSIATFGSENGLDDIESLMRIVDELIDVLLMIYEDPEGQTNVTAIATFCKAAVNAAQDELQGNEVPTETIPNLICSAKDKWSDYLTISNGADEFGAWPIDTQTPEDDEESVDAQPEPATFESQQIGMILGALGGLGKALDTSAKPQEGHSEKTVAAEIPADISTAPSVPTSSSPFGQPSASEPLSAPAPVAINLDQETVNAFADDAVQCVSVIENEVLRYERDPNSLDALRQICRELHTIKGASAAIGLTQLAGFLHRVEDSLEQNCRAATQTDVDVVLQSVDAVRSQLEVLVTATANEDSHSQDRSSETPKIALDSSASPDSIRVNAGQLDRLFDMLAELVMLRNRRDSNVGNLKGINAELLHCVSRLRSLAEHIPSTSGVDKEGGTSPIPVSSLTEIASDMLELGRALRQTIDPINEENYVLNRFIDQFRSEVIELRRLPIHSLFTRLQRPIRDAAKSEGKKTDVKFVNEQVGLERSLHEKLYEPLMHVVRNAVSHGIESAPERKAAGKPEAGTITIEAHSGSNLFVIEVRDDGNGLDYDVIRQRAIERGLVSVDDDLTQEEIANLLFHPGFSTRDSVSEISGRGVGMDVVASSLEEMHGWVELESKKGMGTCLRLLVPRSSFIENVMVFRIAEQYFAFPTRFVVPFASDDPINHGMQLRSILSPNSKPGGPQVPIFLESPDNANTEMATVWVDEIVGTEEVVTRPLPALMHSQRLFTGVTLSGSGDILLILNADTLISNFASAEAEPTCFVPNDSKATPTPDNDSLCILVADDSVTARLCLCRILQSIQYCEILEAKDGSDAFSIYKENRDRIDLVITDIDMPRMTGFDLLREIQVLGRSGPVAPVTVLSSRGDQRSRDTAIQFGAFHHLTKPANESSIQQVLDRVIAQREPTISVPGDPT